MTKKRDKPAMHYGMPYGTVTRLVQETPSEDGCLLVFGVRSMPSWRLQARRLGVSCVVLDVVITSTGILHDIMLVDNEEEDRPKNHGIGIGIAWELWKDRHHAWDRRNRKRLHADRQGSSDA